MRGTFTINISGKLESTASLRGNQDISKYLGNELRRVLLLGINAQLNETYATHEEGLLKAIKKSNIEVSYTPQVSRKIFKVTVTSITGHNCPPLVYYFLATSEIPVNAHMIKYHGSSALAIDVREFDEADVSESISIHPLE